MEPPAAMWWRRRAGVRVRTAVIATVTVGLALGLGSALFVLLLERNLGRAVDDSLEQQAQALASEVHTTSTIVLQRRVGDSNLVQLLDERGQLLVSSPGLRQPLVSQRPRASRSVRETSRLVTDDDEPYRVVALAATTPNDQARTVVVAEGLDEIETSTHTVESLLLVGAPALLLLVAGVTYWLSGRALRPVEAMRRQVADIDARTLHSRVPLPVAHDEVWRLAGTMNHMLDRLEGASTAQQRFVSDASHELRSPLAILRTSVEVAQAHPETSTWESTAEVVLEESLRLERLVADLLLLARSDEQGLQLRREDVDLDDILGREADRLHSNGLHVHAVIHPVRVLGDADRLSRAVRNLVDNASRHAHSSVELFLTRRGGDAVIEVADDGPGIAPADRERVFDRFVRLDDSRSRAFGGTGLGLAIVRQIAQAHEGEVTFLDVEQGTRVRLTLPLRSET